MEYHVHVYAVKGMVEVDVDAKNTKEAMDKAVKKVMEAAPSYHGNFPPADGDFVALMSE